MAIDSSAVTPDASNLARDGMEGAGVPGDVREEAVARGRDAATGPAGQKTPTGQRVEAYATFSFAVGGPSDLAYFTECSLPTLEVDVLEQKEGGYNSGVHLLPGRVKAGRITLKRGVTQSHEMLAWYLQVANGNAKAATRNVTVTMLSPGGAPVMRMSFIRAYPVKWSGPTLKADDNSIAIETLELAFAEFQVEDVGGGLAAPSGPGAAPTGASPAAPAVGPSAGAGNVW